MYHCLKNVNYLFKKKSILCYFSYIFRLVNKIFPLTVAILQWHTVLFSLSLYWEMIYLELIEKEFLVDYDICKEKMAGNLLLLLFFTPLEFFTSVLTDGFSLEFEWQQVSRTCLRILAVLSNAVIWIVSVRLPISKSSRPFNNPLVIVPNALITIRTIVTFMFHSFFNSPARSRYLSFFSFSFRFILWSTGTAKSTILQIFFFFVDYYEVWSSGRD